MAVKVDGLNELLRAFSAADRHLRDDLKDTLQEAAAPVRTDAQTLARSTIRNNTTDWSRMRIGVLGGNTVYVAPVERGIKARANQRLRRRKFADLLRDRAMEPAKEKNIRHVERRLDHLLGEVKAVWERHG